MKIGYTQFIFAKCIYYVCWQASAEPLNSPHHFFSNCEAKKWIPCWLASPSWREFHFWMAETAANLELQLVEKHESPTNWNIKEE